MSTWAEFVRERERAGATTIAIDDGLSLIGRFSSMEEDYRTLTQGPAIVDRSYRSLLEVTGADRASWLHNLTSNEVKRLSPGEGNYAFALNLQGRILFDVNVLVRPNSIWLDIDRRFVDRARKHLDKYVVTEDVRVLDRTTESVRFGLVGAALKPWLVGQGMPNVANLPWFAMTEMTVGDGRISAVRHDFCGEFSIELFVPHERAVDIWGHLTQEITPARLTPVGEEAVQIRRIEAGLPWAGHEISDEYLPAEIDPNARAVSYQKGCYLGQEIVERMRSRGVVARRLAGFHIDGDTVPPVPIELPGPDGKPVGRLTSVCRRLDTPPVIGLGVVKVAAAVPGTFVSAAWDDRRAVATVVSLPFRPAAAH